MKKDNLGCIAGLVLLIFPVFIIGSIFSGLKDSKTEEETPVNVEPIIELNEYIEMTEEEALEKFGEPVYTESHEYDGIKFNEYDFDETDEGMSPALEFAENRKLHKLIIRYTGTNPPWYNSQEELYALFDIDSNEWEDIESSGVVYSAEDGSGELQEFRIYINEPTTTDSESGTYDISSGSVESIEYVFN